MAAGAAVGSVTLAVVVGGGIWPWHGRCPTRSRVKRRSAAGGRLTPLLTASSRRLHGWTDRPVALSIGRLRDDVADANAAACGDASVATTPARNGVSLEPDDALKLGDNLHARLAEFALFLRGRPRLRAAAH
jgi:hypothetical protein